MRLYYSDSYYEKQIIETYYKSALQTEIEAACKTARRGEYV